MKKSVGVILAACAFACAAEAFTVKDVTAAQRWPWNGVLDVDFTIDGAAVCDLFQVEVVAKYADGEKKLYGCSYVSEPLCGRGRNRVSWDVRADYPDLKLSDVQIAVSVHPINSDVYMVIDLSSGPNSPRYPVHYTFKPPTLVSAADPVACAKDPNRTTKVWLKRIKESTFEFGGTQNTSKMQDRTDFKVRLSPYYIGIFEVTQKQWALVMDAWPSKYSNTVYRAARPVAMVNYEDVIGHTKWPVSREITSESFVGRLRARTGLSTLNLPTEAQWVCASKEGQDEDKQIKLTTGLATGRCAANSAYNEDTETFDVSPETGTAHVGTYNANSWGIYDMFGNVSEMCLDAHMKATNLNALYATQYDDAELKLVVDPIGPSTLNSTERYHATRGGSYYNSEAFCSSYRRHYNCRNETGTRNKGIGLRLVVSPEWK